jgi:hypothetical protein
MKAKTRTNALIATALAIAAYVVFGPTDAPIAEVARHSQPLPGGREPQARVAPRQSTMHSLLLLAHRVSNSVEAGALFATHSWYEPPPPPPSPPPSMATTESLTPPIPTAPPLPFSYMGTFKPDGAPPVFFLTRGDRVYDVHVGDTLDNIYSIDGFNGSQLLLTYKPLNIQQQMAVGGTQ